MQVPIFCCWWLTVFKRMIELFLRVAYNYRCICLLSGFRGSSNFSLSLFGLKLFREWFDYFEWWIVILVVYCEIYVCCLDFVLAPIFLWACLVESFFREWFDYFERWIVILDVYWEIYVCCLDFVLAPIFLRSCLANGWKKSRTSLTGSALTTNTVIDVYF
jgi:hypothetical protein